LPFAKLHPPSLLVADSCHFLNPEPAHCCHILGAALPASLSLPSHCKSTPCSPPWPPTQSPSPQAPGRPCHPRPPLPRQQPFGQNPASGLLSPTGHQINCSKPNPGCLGQAVLRSGPLTQGASPLAPDRLSALRFDPPKISTSWPHCPQPPTHTWPLPDPKPNRKPLPAPQTVVSPQGKPFLDPSSGSPQNFAGPTSDQP